MQKNNVGEKIRCQKWTQKELDHANEVMMEFQTDEQKELLAEFVAGLESDIIARAPRQNCKRYCQAWLYCGMFIY